MGKRIVFLIAILIFSTKVPASVLGDLAASMQPGTWRELVTGNTSALTSTGSSGLINLYAMSSAWDPTDKRLYFIGEDHGNFPSMRWIYYDDATNAWVVKGEGQPAMPNLPGHAYDHLTIDQQNRVLYAATYGSTTIWRYPIATNGPWTSESMGNVYVNITMGMEYFPGIGLTNYLCGAIPGGVMIRSEQGAWSYVTAGGNGGYHGFSEYSAKRNCAVFGGANSNAKLIWRLNADKTVTALSDAPVPLGITNYNVVADPATGNFLAMGGEPRELWELNPTGSGTWTKLAGTRVPPSAVGNPLAGMSGVGVFSGSISNYGVAMYVTGANRAFQSVYIYKHATNSAGLERGNARTETATLSVRPAPASVTGTVSISPVGPSARYAIYDIRGKMVADLGGKTVWAPHGVKAGLYVIKAQIGGSAVCQKLILE